MEEQKTIRQSNFELMKIISMLMIIFGHIMLHGKIFENATDTLTIILTFIKAFIYVHVNSFILVTGYFQCKQKLKFSKIIQLNNTVWFYKVIIPLILVIYGIEKIDIVSSFKLLSPVSHNDYWFMTNYILLYFLSPILNVIVNNISKSNFKRMLVLLILLFSILPTLTNQEFYNTNSGYTLLQFVILYFIGAYFRFNNINDCYYLKHFSLNLKKLIFIFLYIILGIISFFIVIGAKSIIGYNQVFDYLGGTLSSMVDTYNNPLIMMQSIFYFLFFSLLSFKNKIINIISATTLGIYLIHDNNFLRKYIYNWLGLSSNIFSSRIIGKMVVCTFIVFTICFIIEFLRKYIFKFIYNRKISCKIRVKYREYIKSLGFNINW